MLHLREDKVQRIDQEKQEQFIGVDNRTTIQEGDIAQKTT
jgi:hypothetical protein